MSRGFIKEEEKKPVLAGSGKKQYYVGPNPSTAGAGRGTGSSDVAKKIETLREKAKDKSLPQDVRNQFLDDANKLEEKAAKKAGVNLAKGGAVVAKAPPKKMMYGGMADKPMMAKGGAAKKELPMRGQRTATNMAKGGSVAKKGKK